MGNKSCFLSKNDECVICMEKKIDTLFLPCGHFGMLNYILLPPSKYIWCYFSDKILRIFMFSPLSKLCKPVGSK